MSYGLKYELLCTSKINSNANKLKLLFDGYTGVGDDPVDRNMPGDSPLVLRKDKAVVIRGTSLDFGIREAVDFELDEFYTNNPKKIKAELYEGATLLWTGYNLPQQYQAAYIPAPGTIRFTATDGLGLLKNEKYNQTGTNSQLATIIYCVDKIGLALGYSIAINLFETTHDHALSPLAQTYEDSSIFNGLDCYTVIEKILNKYDAEITQVNARWHITRSVDKKSTRMLYSTSGVYEITEAAPAVLDLGYPGAAGVEVWPVGRLERSMEPGANKVTITHDFGRKASLLDNYEFWRYAGGAFTGWTKVGTFDTLQMIKDGKAYALLAGYSADDTMQIYQTIPVTNAPGEDFVFELNVAPIGRTVIPGRREIQTIQMTVRMSVVFFDGTTYYWQSITEGNKGWITTPTIIEVVKESSLSSPIWYPVRILAAELPAASGTLTVAIYRIYSATAPSGGVSYTGLAVSEPSVYFLNAGELYPSGLKTLAVFDNSTEPGDLGTIALLAADAPDLANKSLLYKNITRLLDGTPTTSWHVLGDATEYSQVIQLARTLASNNRIARQKLTGTIKGTGINFNSIIKHAYNGNREFEIAEVQWDLYNETYQVTLLELLAWSAETVTFTTESENTSSATATSGGSIIGVTLGNDAGGSLTADDLLTKLLTVDGAASLLDADLLDGAEGALYARLASPTFTGDVTMPGTGIWDSSGNVGIGTIIPVPHSPGKSLIVSGVDSGQRGMIELWDNAGGKTILQTIAGTTYLGSLLKGTGSGNLNLVYGDGTIGISISGSDGTIIANNSIKGESLESVTAFSTGFFGNGYKVIETGGISSFEVDNLRVRGKLSAYELEINKISSVNGGLVISVANGTAYLVIGTTLYFDTKNGSNPIQFKVGDYIKAQNWTGVSGETITTYVGAVTTVTQGDGALGNSFIVATTISGTAWNGIELVQMGGSDAARQSIIYLTAHDTNNPYIEGHSGITDGTFTDATRKFRLGNLTGITDAALNPSGYGLYSQNVFLSGKIVASSGTIGGFTLSATTLIAGSGATAIELDTATGIHLGATAFADAPFSVTRAGALKATGITELGTATSGGFNIAMSGYDIWENAYFGNSSSIRINYKSYQGGASYTRNFFVYDGKNNLLFGIDGGTQNVSIYGNLVAYGSVNMQSATKALIIPRMIEEDRDAITEASGMMIYNTTTGEFNVCVAGIWKVMGHN